MTTFQYLCLRLGLLLDRLPARRKPAKAKRTPAGDHPALITGIYVTPGADAAALATLIAERGSNVRPRAGRAY